MWHREGRTGLQYGATAPLSPRYSGLRNHYGATSCSPENIGFAAQTQAKCEYFRADDSGNRAAMTRRLVHSFATIRRLTWLALCMSLFARTVRLGHFLLSLLPVELAALALARVRSSCTLSAAQRHQLRQPANFAALSQ
jgi:hypothetical protein